MAQKTVVLERLLCGMIGIGLTLTVVAADWLQFRGAGSNSVTADAAPPQKWSEKEIAWKVPLPGRGPSSPIVVGDRVVVTCSSGVNQDRLHVLCFDTGSGKPLWERQFWAYWPHAESRQQRQCRANARQ